MTNTVTGAILPESLGIVAMHEHLLYALTGWQDDPTVAFDHPAAFEAIANALREFKKAGGKTLVDAGGTLLGRDATMLANLASSAGVNLVASTGLPVHSAIPGHFLALAETNAAKRGRGAPRKLEAAQTLASIFYEELTAGMTEPNMIRSKARAGIAVAGVSQTGITDAEELSLQGAALAAKRAGVCVMTSHVTEVERQLEILAKSGLGADRVVIGHCDDGRAIDPERDKKLARKGAYIAYDHVGWEDRTARHVVPDDRRVDLVKALVAAGFAERIILSCNAVGHRIGAPKTKFGFAHLLESFMPKLKKAGISQKDIDTILIENPKRILTAQNDSWEAC